MTTQLEQAAKDALVALERAAELLTRVGLSFKGIDTAITALRAALEQPAQDKPVGRIEGRMYDDGTRASNVIHWAGKNAEDDFPVGTLLYTRPQQPAQDDVEQSSTQSKETFDQPVAWICGGLSSDEKHSIDYWPGDIENIPIGTMLYTRPQQPAQDEPVAWLRDPAHFPEEDSLVPHVSWKRERLNTIPLYTALPQQQQRCYCGNIFRLGVVHREDSFCDEQPARKPLTDEQIHEVRNGFGYQAVGLVAFARAIEAAHQIGVKK